MFWETLCFAVIAMALVAPGFVAVLMSESAPRNASDGEGLRQDSSRSGERAAA
jgi:hypothetical protein